MIASQMVVVQEKIKALTQISDMLNTRSYLTKKGLAVNKEIDSIDLKECETTPILLGPQLSTDSHVLEGWYYLVDFYEFCRKNHGIRGLPTGTIISYKDLLQENTTHPAQYYYCPVHGSSYPTNAVKPQGLYLIGQAYTEYAMSRNLYNRLFAYIKEAGLEICGNAYEEFLLDEISTTDPTQYLLQIAIHVQK